MYPPQSGSCPSSVAALWKALIMSSEQGFMMAAESPACRAMARKAPPMRSRAGRPKETLLTPSTVPQPVRSRIRRRASRVVLAALPSALTGMVRVSNTRSRRDMPSASARARIRSAMAARPSAVSGMPRSSRVRATSTPPYFFARGSTASITAALPLTELIMALPL